MVVLPRTRESAAPGARRKAAALGRVRGARRTDPESEPSAPVEDVYAVAEAEVVRLVADTPAPREPTLR
jgi:hypothetical protein